MALIHSITISAQEVVISQIMYDSPLNEQITQPPYSNGEFVELYNMSGSTVDLTDWVLCGEGKSEQVRFSAGTHIAPHSHIVVAYRHTKTPDFVLTDLFSNPHNVPIVYQHSLILKNTGENLWLYNRDHIVIDSVYYDGISHKRKPDRLCADNADSIAGSLCRSIQRTKVVYDAYGRAVCSNSHWQTRYVSIGQNTPQREEYISSDFYGGEHTALLAGENYMVEITPLDATSSVQIKDGKVSMANGIRAAVTLSYVDEQNRLYQQTIRAATPTSKDLVVRTEYDGDSRTVRQWLPLITEGSQPIDASTYHTMAIEQYANNAPYTTTTKEVCDHGRVVRTTTAGEAYQAHPTTMQYEVNTAPIPRYRIAESGLERDGEYAAGTLRITTTIDPNGKPITHWVDAMGREIMLRQGTQTDTYYLYDDLGRLRYTLPPAITRQLSAQSALADTAALMQQYAYIYRYDKRGNVVCKHIPGAGEIRSVYDKTGRLAMQQDANQHKRGNYWTIMKYDTYGRVAYTAEVNVGATSHARLIEQFAQWVVIETFAVGQQEYPMEDTGYSRYFYHVQKTKLLTVCYYDTYDFLQCMPADVAALLQYRDKSEYGKRYDNALGLQTGKRIYNLSDNGYTTTAYYYDRQGRVIQSHSIDAAGNGTHTYTVYNFDGTPQRVYTEYDSPMGVQTERYAYSYDHAGRPVQTKYQLNDTPEVLLSEWFYNEHRQLTTQMRHNRRDTTRYAYDIRNAQTQSVNRHFSEYLFYADTLPNGATAYYNGSISASRIHNGDSVLTMGYLYDAQNRLTESLYLRNEAQPATAEFFEYDAMGNIRRLQRYTQEQQVIDDLQYTYCGNQVQNITDYAGSADQYTVKEYQDLNTTDSVEQFYDPNGNLIIDLDRGITHIAYNLLNLPDTICFANGNQIINRYDAAGNKQETQTITLQDTKFSPTPLNDVIFDTSQADTCITHYSGNREFMYTPSRQRDSLLLQKSIIRNTEGYTQYTYTGASDSPKPMQYYFHKDHLGNVCAVWNATTDEVVQRTNYYPSGVPMAQSMGQSVQPMKYNAHEYIEVYGYDMYDYGFRGYYATIGRFTSIDPLCERTPWQSPYAYANNNWINQIDIFGLAGVNLSVPRLNWVAVDKNGNVQGWGTDNNDDHVYEIDDDWDRTYEGLSKYDIIGWELEDLFGNPNGAYMKGVPCLFMKGIQQFSIVGNTATITASKVLYYGNSRVSSGNIDNTFEATMHYFKGNGEAIMLGGDFTRQQLLRNGDFLSIHAKVCAMQSGAMGKFSINMTWSVFHIGNTTISYYKKDDSIIYYLGVNDGFWDVLFIIEKSKYNPWGIEGDREGRKLEVYQGEPYKYVPMQIIL